VSAQKNISFMDINFYAIFNALFLGVIEGLTEFLPVSSTGHLLLVGHFLGFQSPGNSFAVLIQLGAICAILSVYAAKLLDVAHNFFTDRRARYFIYSMVIAFLPAALIGVLAHGVIKSVLFEAPRLICVSLIIGGLVLLVVDRLNLVPRYRDATQFPLALSFAIGFFQCLAMLPGVSRSGATIVGALLLGADKRAAAEFSFFLAMPTMAGAFSYDLYKNYQILSFDDGLSIVLGFIAAFISAVFVVRQLLNYISRHGFSLFAWWRIGVGALGLIALGLWG